MSEIKVLVKRNIKIFLRDKTAVFISFLSVIILLTIYLLFLKNNYVVNDFVEIIGKNEMDFIINSIIISGVLVMNTLTLSLGNLGSIVTDLHYNILDGFLVTPIKRYKIILAYCISSFLITIVLTVMMWLLAILIIGLQTKIWYSFNQILYVILYLILFSFISTAFMVLLVTFIKSVNAFGVISGIIGTIIGFIAGIYIPLYILPKTIQSISGFLPFSHMTIYLKQILLVPKFIELKNTLPIEAINSYKEAIGMNYLKIFNHEVKPFIILLLSSFVAIGFLLIASFRLTNKIKK